MQFEETAKKILDNIFNVSSVNFEPLALEIFRFQYHFNAVYREYAQLLRRNPDNVHSLLQIPFLPVSFFKTHRVTCCEKQEAVFESSGTTGQIPSRHYIADLNLYETSFTKCFEQFFGKPEKYVMLFLLPSYLERKHSSLVYMAEKLIKLSKHEQSGFFLHEYEKLHDTIIVLEEKKQPYLLFGVTFALLEFSEKYSQKITSGIIIETGGMKGRGKELVRDELHAVLKQRFQSAHIFSEYGMTELMSQAYLKEDGKFHCPSWMKIMARDIYNPFTVLPAGTQGAINIIDLANLFSCSYIETEDVGKVFDDGSFEISGRMDASEIRGCNLMIG
jgi:phenylacetate-coenzyme A ligase PaaK-like adenylate-forming protein